MVPAPDLEAQIARLEKENHNLAARIEKLEKKQGFSLPALLADVLLLAAAGVLAGYLGLYPRPVQPLPLRAGTVAAEQFVLRSADGSVRARVVASGNSFRVVDEQNKDLVPPP